MDPCRLFTDTIVALVIVHVNDCKQAGWSATSPDL